MKSGRIRLFPLLGLLLAFGFILLAAFWFAENVCQFVDKDVFAVLQGGIHAKAVDAHPRRNCVDAEIQDHRQDDGDGHDRHLVDQADRCDHRIQREHDVQEHDLDQDGAEPRRAPGDGVRLGQRVTPLDSANAAISPIAWSASSARFSVRAV